MNWVDLVVLAVVALSAVLAFMRGLVREVLGIGAWVGAAAFAVWAFPDLQPRFRTWIGNPDLADPATYAAAFVGALILLSVVTGIVGGVIAQSMLGGIDRTLGVLFGLLRGALLVAAAYIGLGWVLPPDRWPAPVLEARVLPYAYQGAELLAGLLPEAWRPAVAAPPPGRETKAADLMQAIPRGSALGAAGRP